MFIWYFRARKLLILVSRVSGHCCLSVFDFIRQIIIPTAQQWRIIGAFFSTWDRHRELNQLRWQNMSAHLTNETSNWLKQLPMHLNWAIYNVSDLYIDPHVCFSRPCHRNGLIQRPVHNATRGLYALAHHTEAEKAIQGDIVCLGILILSQSVLFLCGCCCQKLTFSQNHLWC